MPEFQDLVARLRGTPWAVPAPLNVLRGPLSARLASSGDPRRPGPASWEASADLKGRRQSLVARARGTLAPASGGEGPRVEADVLLRDVVVELPRLDIAQLPKTGLDKRISTGPEPPAPSRARPAPRLRARVRTEAPVRLLSNLAKDPVPVALDLSLSAPPGVMGGTVSVRSFNVELFRREAAVDHVTAFFAPGSAAAALDGAIVYRAPRAEVRILLRGTTARPQVEFVSEPPLRRDQILALLVFGKSPEELDLDQAASIGDTHAALESSAFGLVSLYYLGVTPVERVRYDPASHSYNVKLRLPGRVNLELGSDFDGSRDVRLRKFLAPHWALESDIGSRTEEGQAATTFLEWFNRY